MALKDDLDTATTALGQVDVLSDRIAADVTATQAEVSDLLSKIPNATTLQEAQDLAANAQKSVNKLTSIATALEALGTSAQPSA